MLSADWLLAFLMDNYLVIDLEMTAQANHVEDISLDLNEAALNFISRVYLSRALQADAEDPSISLAVPIDASLAIGSSLLLSSTYFFHLILL